MSVRIPTKLLSSAFVRNVVTVTLLISIGLEEARRENTAHFAETSSNQV
jgi:hypothetical protein